MTQPLQGQAAVDQLLEILDLRQVDAATFTGDSPQTGAQRVFGGQVAGQALVAAGRTVDPARLVHSLHGYFVRPGDPTEPITFHVETIRDGRSFSVRRSTAKQHGKTIFFMSASFQVPEEGLDHHEPAPAGVPAPEDVPTMRDWVARYPSRRSVFNASPQAVDVRYIGQPGWVPPGDRDAEPQQRVWMRVDGKLPDDPLIHACALTYASDLSLLDAVLSYHGEVWGPGGVVGASLDHALWFHRSFRADEWFLYDSASPSASRSRGLASGRMFTRDGRHIASAVQEGLLRRVGA
ncbi:acyl-CoA thioesterase [Actinoplanes siamensis]|uniref:Acyl-CoA thioesterase 2 n=1 Tax=Actinoplanes siamensis TaxID=1223317 RepID=A0A919TKP7_9ACTN|nr:acyl-CoA thioesterase II [Actinoplanes siamensis]GIF05812.1 acyl-CoA thioesterase II [Actinoplanes siamensis]